MTTSYYISTQYSRVKHQGHHFELNYTPVKFPDCTKQMLSRGVKCEAAIFLVFLPLVGPHQWSFMAVSCMVVMLLGEELSTDRHIKTWQDTRNCFCGSSCCKRCFQEHILPHWHKRYHPSNPDNKWNYIYNIWHGGIESHSFLYRQYTSNSVLLLFIGSYLTLCPYINKWTRYVGQVSIIIINASQKMLW